MEKKKVFIIKIGTSVLLGDDHNPDESQIDDLATQISTLVKEGHGIILVVSGAIAFGSYAMKLQSIDHDTKEAVAGVGQAYLISRFTEIFARKDLKLAQLLLTRDDLSSPVKRHDISYMLNFYLDVNVIPILNENDVIELNSFGGNDILAAEIATLLNVHHLIILSTMKGSKFGIGGGETKHKAIQTVSMNNIKAHIVDGKQKDILLKTIL